jgi:hypothetical protein
MALYDKASLVLIPSGTKAGTVYSQKPVPSTDVLTDELLTNGTFENATDWSTGTGWSIANGVAECDGSVGYLSYNNLLDAKVETYVITYTIKTSNNQLLRFAGGSSAFGTLTIPNTIGTHTLTLTSNGKRYLQFYSQGGWAGTLDDISLKKVVTGDFDFTRSTYATRVNSQGLIEKERGNLLLQSNNFDTTWTKADSMLTPVGGQSGYDGSSDAWKIQRSDSSARFIKQTISQSGVQTFSVYAKKGNVDYITLLTTGGNLTKGIFSLPTDGTGTNTLLDSDNIDANITHIGSGWYRVSITLDEPVADVRIYPSETGTAEGGSTTDAFVYIQDAQLEQGLVATDYIETTTAAVYTGITDNVPRLDYDGDCPSLLLEPQRSNLIDSAEYYNGSSWSRVRSTITDNAETSPEGVDNASALIATAVNDDHYIYATPATTNAIHTYSVFLKKGNRTWARLWETTTNVFVDFNLDTGATGTTNGTIIDKGTEDFGNGWYRCYFTYDTGSAGLKVCRIYSLEGDNDRSYLGDGTTEEIYIYGAQLEEGSYATSYIPTYGTSVTRNADDLELSTLSTVFDSSGDYTVFFEHGRIHEGVEAQFLYMRNVSCCYITISAGGSGTFTIGLWDGTNYTAVIVNDENFVVGSPIKIIVRVQNSIPSVFVNGAERTVPDTSVVPRGFHLYQFNKNHRIYKELYFNEALTDQECIDLTT